MTKPEYDASAALLAKQKREQESYNSTYLSKEAEIKALCNECLSKQSADGIDSLRVLAFVHPVGKTIIHDTNWGRVVGFALTLDNGYKDKSASFLLKLSNLEQLLYFMRTMRFLHYRYSLLGEEDAYLSLQAIFDEFQMPENVREMIKNAATVPEDE